MSAVVKRLKANKKLEGEICNWCNKALNLGDDAAICEACNKVHHAKCWDEHNGCSTIDCENAPFVEVKDPELEKKAREVSLRSFETTCPHCNAVIRKGVDRCPNCHRFTSPDGIYHGSTQLSSQARNALIAGIVGLFILGIVLGPVAIHQARKAKETIRSDYRLHGEGVATAAEIVGWLAVIGWAIVICTRFGARY